MIARWPSAGAGKQVAVVRQSLPVPSTEDVLARALARSAQRGQRVARWRTARRWCYYHAWRHGLPVLLALLAPSSQHLWQQPHASPQAMPKQVAPEQTIFDTDPPLRLQTSSFGAAALPTPNAAATAMQADATLEAPLKTDKSLHSQEP